MDSVNFVANANANANLVICKNCKKEVDILNTKRIFGQKNIYECKGNELKNCEEILCIERRKEKEIGNLENEKKQKMFNDEYLKYINENEDNFIKLPNNFQYRDANVRYYDPVKKIVFKKYINGYVWSIDAIKSEINFDYLVKSSQMDIDIDIENQIVY